MNKRDRILNLISGDPPPNYVPAAFFLHFDSAFHTGSAAIEKHLEFFRYTGMDFVKIQYEQPLPSSPPVLKPGDWGSAPLYSEELFEPTLQVVQGLIQAAQEEALVILTLYSPFMWAAHLAGDKILSDHLQENPEAVSRGLQIMTENVLTLARGCKRAGVDGFYASSQGGEAARFGSTEIFRKYIRPTDLAVWDEIQSCRFNVLHICDFVAGYEDLAPFLDYPSHAVNCSLKVGSRNLTPEDVSTMFARPFMGGLERTGVIATGNPQEIRQAVANVVSQSPSQFILAADCTVPSDTPWKNLRIAIDTAHHVRR